MSVKDVSYLRKSGRLDDALKLAKEEIDEEYNEWTAMSMFWVLRDYIANVYVPRHDMDAAQATLCRMERLLVDMRDDNGAGEAAYHSLCHMLIPNALEVKRLCDMSKRDPARAYTAFVQLFGTAGTSLAKELHEQYGWIIYRYLKSEAPSLSSQQVRVVLRDYIFLQNERPSVLHTSILNLALNLHKSLPDFNLYKFFLLWDPRHLRSADYEETTLDGRTIPSLMARVCRALVDADAKLDISELLSKVHTRSEEMLDMLRQAEFWKMLALHREGHQEELYVALENYVARYASRGGSHWHSEILKLADRSIPQEDDGRFVRFLIKWDGSGNLCSSDWRPDTDGKGHEYPALGTKVAHRAFQAVEHNAFLHDDNVVLVWLKSLYTRVTENVPDDWSLRSYAKVCVWLGEREESVAVYKKLLARMGDKYYLWSELAGCVSDRELRIGLLGKALQLEHNEDFLGDVRLSLAQTLWEVGDVDKARAELSTYARHRAEKSWRLSDMYGSLCLRTASPMSSTYICDVASLMLQAEDYVYSSYDWWECVLTEKWEHKNQAFVTIVGGEGLTLSVPVKRFETLKQCELGDVLIVTCRAENEAGGESERFIPLLIRRSDAARWSALYEKYGVVEYINQEKHVAHILTEDSRTAFCNTYTDLTEGSYIRFREYDQRRNQELVVHAACVEIVPQEEALAHMPHRVVVVDDVNDAKKLFHIVLGPQQVSDIVRYDQTPLRPKIGEFLEITYCKKTNKEGRKRLKIFEIKPTTARCPNVVKRVRGFLLMKYKWGEYMPADYDDDDFTPDAPDFAFIGDYYVHKRLLEKYKIKTDCEVIADLVLGGDNKWKVYDLTLTSEA